MPCFEGLHGRNIEIVFYAFDLIYVDSYDLTKCPLIAPKALL